MPMLPLLIMPSDNNIDATKVSDYGARVAQIYKNKPWEYLTKAAERKGGD